MTTSYSDQQSGYGPSDARATLRSVKPPRDLPPSTGYRPPSSFELASLPPRPGPVGERSWTVRGSQFFVTYTEVGSFSELPWLAFDESIVVVLGARGELIAGEGAASDVAEDVVAVLPAGAGMLRLRGPGVVVQVLTKHSGEQLLTAANADHYLDDDPRVAGVGAGALPSTDRIHVYPLAAAKKLPGVFGRIYRSSGLMVNVLDPEDGPRDPDRLSPHSHDDFEQCTITVAGDYVHHCRTPWSPNSSMWRDDDHLATTSPSVTLIPPGVIHTSQGVGPGRHQLIDVFAPPRADFGAAPGWVRNAEDFPVDDSRDPDQR